MFALDEAERKKRCVLFMLETVNYSRVMAIVALECKYKWRGSVWSSHLSSSFPMPRKPWCQHVMNANTAQNPYPDASFEQLKSSWILGPFSSEANWAFETFHASKCIIFFQNL